MAVEHSVEISDAPNNDDGKIRTGTVWTCIAHIITGVIGAGVLSLAWSTAQLGWIAGPSTMLCFAVVTYISAFMLSECYRSPHPVNGARNYSYMDAVRRTLGKKHTWFCGFLQYLSLFGTSTAYVITTATCKKHTWFCGFLQYLSLFGTSTAYVITTAACMRAVQRSNCYHKEGHSAPCSGKDGFFMLIFGVVQIFFSQIPDFHNMQWLSVAAAVMSFTYSFIGLGLGLAKVMGDGRIKGGIGGIHTASTAQKVWKVSQAIGDVAFAYPYSIIVIEIQDTLKSPPPENQTMKKASMASIIITTFFYLCCGCFGYAAFGDDTPGNLLTGFGFYEPFWLVDLANVCIILHLIGGYQIFSQPIFAFVERWFSKKLPSGRLMNGTRTIQLPFLPPFRINLFRIFFRTLYVALTTGLALGFPYFNQVLALLGAITFWPLAIYFPVEMYFVQKKISPWTSKWVVLQVLSLGCLLVSIIALVGSIEGLFSQRL